MEKIKNFKLTASAISLATLLSLVPLTTTANAVDVNTDESIGYEQDWDFERKASAAAFVGISAGMLGAVMYLGSIGSKYADQEQREARRKVMESQPRMRIISSRPIVQPIQKEVREVVDYSVTDTKTKEDTNVLSHKNTNVKLPNRSLVYRNIPMKTNTRAFRR